jgi:hypothetical protein
MAPVTRLSAEHGALLPTLAAVRTNCHISDAKFATDYTLCVYLLKMREFYRWEYGLPFGATLPHDELTEWLTDREALWEQLEHEQFQPVPANGQLFDPFDATAINAVLNPLGYVYSSGYGHGMKPVFFLGTLKTSRKVDNFTLLVSGTELARDLAAPPAMSIQNSIFIRRESLRRMLWERLEEWRWNRPDNAMKCALECYEFERDPDAALEAMTDNELHCTLLHEVGEIQAGSLLGPGWEELLASLGHSKAEIMLRAVRDHLADALSTLPALLENAKPASLHFYFANLSNMRKALAPGLLAAYEIWKVTGSTRELEQFTLRSADHWSRLAMQILQQFDGTGPEHAADLVHLIETHALPPGATGTGT